MFSAHGFHINPIITEALVQRLTGCTFKISLPRCVRVIGNAATLLASTTSSVEHGHFSFVKRLFLKRDLKNKCQWTFFMENRCLCNTNNSFVMQVRIY